MTMKIEKVMKELLLVICKRKEKKSDNERKRK